MNELKRPTDEKPKLAHVTVGINDGPVQHKSIPAGETVAAVLKTELGVDPAVVLYLLHGKTRQLLNDNQTVEVKSGMHFEAIGGGGVS